MKQSIKIPPLGESIIEATISNWWKNEGDYVQMDEIVAELESEKATFELPSPQAGILRIKKEAGSTVSIDEVIGEIESAPPPKNEEQKKESNKKIEAPIEKPVAPTTPAPASQPTTDKYAKGHPSPAAEKILSEKNIPTSSIQGTGVGGRITKEDAQKVDPTATSPSLKTEGRTDRRENMSTLRKTIAKRLVTVKNETALLTTFNEVNMKPVMDLRAKYKEAFKNKYGVNLGFMSFFIKSACAALHEFPIINAYLDKNEIVYHNYCDISIAVSTPRGLVVPVIRNAETLSMAQIEEKVNELATRGRDGKLSIDEMTGGTFSITNGGIFGSMLSTPIINPPQSAILGMHNIVERPIAVDGQVTIRPIMYLALSYDHRLIDGRDSVQFLVTIKNMLEDPHRLILKI